jgi:FKBP-type peptidyl-prolyl cis-trans isomerase FkpA
MSNNIVFLVFIVVMFFVSCKPNYHEQQRKLKLQKEQYEKNLMMANRGLVSRDSTKIVGLIRARGWEMKSSRTGLWYQILEKGDGPKAKIGQVAELNYNVRLLNNELVYSSDSTGPLRFQISKGGVERGLEEGVLLLNQGDSARFILPPHMAHHLMGDQQSIPPRSIIIYEVRLNSLLK